MRYDCSCCGREGAMNQNNKKERYLNQILFEGIGEDGQRGISDGSVCIVGCGGLGAMSAMTCARAGVGRIRIIDRDFVEEKNLHRQVLFDEEDARAIMPKAIAAEEKLRKINSKIRIEGVVDDVNFQNIEDLLRGFDVILDGTDNFEARFLINEFSVKFSVPWIYGAARGSYGLTFTVFPGDGPCLQCVFESSPPPGISRTCLNAGIIPSVAYLVSNMQCVELLKILAGRKNKLKRTLSIIDPWEGVSSEIHAQKQGNDCPVCDQRKFTALEGAGSSSAASLYGRNSVQIRPGAPRFIDLRALEKEIGKRNKVFSNDFLLRIIIGEYEMTLFPDGRAIVAGTEDEEVAKSLYAEYVR